MDTKDQSRGRNARRTPENRRQTPSRRPERQQERNAVRSGNSAKRGDAAQRKGQGQQAREARRGNTAQRENRARQEKNTRRPPEEPRRNQNPAAEQQTVPQRPPEGQATQAPLESQAEEVVFRPAAQPRTPKGGKDSARTDKRASKRRRLAQRAKEREEQKKRRKNRPAVTYTQPNPFQLNRLLMQIAVVLAVVVAISMGLSVFFKVKQVVVYGNNAYGAWTVQEASGIQTGDKLLSVNNARASGKIKAALPYVNTVRVGIKLPDTVNIYIEEFPVAYAIQTGDGTWWLMTSEGKAVEQIDSGTASGYTKVLGVTLDNPVAGEPVKAVLTTPADTPSPTGATGTTEETVPVTVTGTDRLNAAKQILTCLEDNEIVGEVASVNVSSLANIELWYGQRYQVKLGDTSNLDKKIAYMRQAIAQQNDYEMGTLDVSFVTWPDQVGFTPVE